MKDHADYLQDSIDKVDVFFSKLKQSRHVSQMDIVRTIDAARTELKRMRNNGWSSMNINPPFDEKVLCLMENGTVQIDYALNENKKPKIMYVKWQHIPRSE